MLIRPATTRDARGIARVQVRGRQIGYRGIVPDEDLARISRELLASMTPPTGSGKEARRQKGLPNADCRFRLPPGRAATSTPRPGRRESAKSRELCATSTREARHRGSSLSLPLCL